MGGKVVEKDPNAPERPLQPSDLYDAEAVDQLTRERGICLNKNCDVRKFFLLLRECTIRVKAKSFTAETCQQELVDLMHSIDRCVADKAFVKFA